MNKSGGLIAALALVLAGVAIPAQAEQMRVDGYYPAASDGAASLRSIAVADFAGEDGPQLALQVGDVLRQVRVDGQPWVQVLVGRFGRGAEGELGGTVRTRFAEQPITLSRNVCVAYDAYDNCTQRADQNVPCARVTVSVRPDLRLVARGGQLLWSWSQESARTADYCRDYDDQPDFDGLVETMLGEFAQTIRYQLAPAHEARNVRVMEGRGDLPQPLRDPYRNAIRQTQRDPAGACAAFAALAPQAPQHPQLAFNVALCAEREGRWDDAAVGYTRLLTMRGARGEAQDGLNRLAAYRRGRAQIEGRGR